MNYQDCPYPHFIEILYGVKSCPIEELPKICPFCGHPVEYADTIYFCEEFPSSLANLEENDIIEVGETFTADQPCIFTSSSLSNDERIIQEPTEVKYFQSSTTKEEEPYTVVERPLTYKLDLTGLSGFKPLIKAPPESKVWIDHPLPRKKY